MKYFSVSDFCYRFLEKTLLLIKLTACASSVLVKSRCANPHQEILDAEWALYKKLVPVDIKTCQITKTVDYCENKTSKVFTYYDTSNNCNEESKRKGPIETTTTYSCLEGNILKVKEEKMIELHRGHVCPEADELLLPSGDSCKYSLGFCYHSNAGYVWDTKLQEGVSCNNLVPLRVSNSGVVKLSLDKDYLIFQERDEVVAVELAEQIALCGSKMWSNKRGLFAINDTAFQFERRGFVIHTYVHLQSRQSLYESLVDDCERNREVGQFFYFYATIALLAYVALHFVFLLYNHLTNCRTFSRVKVGTCQWLFQSWINKTFVNTFIVKETILRSDMEMVRVESRPSYYKFFQPNNDPGLNTSRPEH